MTIFDPMWQDFAVCAEGATLVGERRGNGAPLVLVHGFGLGRSNWDAVIAALPPDLPVVRYDLRGFGQSPQDDTVEFSHVDDLQTLLDALGIARVSICGLSLGGGIAARFAMDHPGRTDRLILIAPALQGIERSSEWLGNWKACLAAAREGDMDRARAIWCRNPLFASLDETHTDHLHKEVADFPGRQWIRDPQRKQARPDLERLAEIAAPTLLLIGEREIPEFRRMADAAEAAIATITRVDYPGAGHMLTYERPSEMAKAIAGFLA